MSDIWSACLNELRRIFALRPVFSILILAPVIYAVFYPQPYLNEALRNVPLALVDRDGTASSRELARRIEATPDVAITMALPDLPSAEREVFAHKISGVLLIPRNFERDLLHGRASPVALYADASYFLIYQRISSAVVGVTRAFGVEVETTRLIGAGVDPALARAATDPMPLTAVPLFNPQGGYATYLLPAAFVLILQQTLLIGVALLATLPTAGARPSIENVRAGERTLSAVAGKLIAYLALETVILPLYLVVLPWFYNVPRLGSLAIILIFAIPFVLAVAGFALVLAELFRRPLAVQLACAAIGLPFFFLAGFAWPAEAIPTPVQVVALLVPSTSAIDGFVRISQMGANLFEVRLQFAVLWGLAIGYSAIAVMAARWRSRVLRPQLPAGNSERD